MSETPFNQTASQESGDLNAEAPPQHHRLATAIVVSMILILAFLLASFPARNSDVRRHLATGRALLDGTATLGIDPFAYTTDGVNWINHAWLWDVVLYLSYLCSGEHLVLFNAFFSLGLAAVLLLGAGVSRSPWTAGLSVALGLVCIGPHLILAPQVVSYLLFGFILWRLNRTETWSARTTWPVFLALAVWANCDEWFFLGPCTVAFFAIGKRAFASDDSSLSWRGAMLVGFLAFAACLPNPHHVRVFRLPDLLFWSGAPAASGGPFSGFAFLTSISNAPIPAPQVAFAVLIGLGLIAAWVIGGTQSGPLTSVCMLLLGLSLYRSAAIPFFAIAACPMVSRLGARCARPVVSSSGHRVRFSWLGPAATVVILFSSVLATCPGWLQGTTEPRGWYVFTDTSMKQMAEQIALWRETGHLPEPSRGFHSSVDLAHYVEWHCPGEKVFRDGRTGLFSPKVSAEFNRVTAALATGPGSANSKTAWPAAKQILNERGVTHLVIADLVERRLAMALRSLWQRPSELTLVSLEGRAAAFVWSRPPSDLPRPELTPVDLHRLAFDPVDATRAPRRGSGREPKSKAWWDCLTWTQEAGMLEQDEAIALLIHFEALRPVYLEQSRVTWEAAVLAAQLGLVAPQESPLPALASFFPYSLLTTSRRPIPESGPTPMDSFVFQLIGAHADNLDQGPPGSLFLAVRAARRALRDNPDASRAHLALGRAYERLHHLSAERGTAPSFPLLEQLRKVQTLVALKRAVHLKPDLLSAHELLANLYLEARGLDLALAHIQTMLRLTRAAGPRSDESKQDFTARIERLTGQEQVLGKQVRERLNLVDAQGFKLDAYGKARLAESNGLPGHALEHLLQSNYGEFGKEGALMQLLLLLHAGRVGDVRMMLDPAQENTIGSFNYHWLQTLLAAVDGDYEQADKHLLRLVARVVDLPDLGLRQVEPRAAVALLFGQQMLTGGSINPGQALVQALTFGPSQGPETQALFVQRLQGVVGVSHRDGDRHALRGLMALEAGEIETARLAIRGTINSLNATSGSGFLARHYLRLMAPR